MKIKKIKINDLKVNDSFSLSYPLRPRLYEDLKKQFPDFPLIVINRAEEIVFGIDFYHYFKTVKDTGDIAVLQGDFNEKEALFLNFNLKNKFMGLNLYEKLIFVKKTINLTGTDEIYEKTGLDININRELSDKLERVTDSDFKEVLTKDRIALKSALKLCDFERKDRICLLDLFKKVYFSTSQQLKILEMVEEILFREKSSLTEIFKKLAIGQYFDLEKPRKKIIDEIFKCRYPVYSKKEQEWEEEIKKLKLPGHIKISQYPFFEKKQVDLHITLQYPEQLKKIITKIKN